MNSPPITTTSTFDAGKASFRKERTMNTAIAALVVVILLVVLLRLLGAI